MIEAPLAFLVAAAFVAFWIFVLAMTARRLLEVPAGPLRLLLSGGVGLTVAVVAVGQRMQTGGERGAFIFLWVGIGLLSAMGLLILSEIVLPAGTLPRPVHWWRAFRRWRQRTGRYTQVGRIAIRHGLGAYLSGRRDPTAHAQVELARRLRHALEEAGVVFVKLGQILSTRHDLLPPAFVAELSRLRSQVETVEWTEIAAVLTEELGAPVDEVFADFDPVPLAAASIGQVHRARLRSGEWVAVKVQRPGIRRIVDGDLDIALRMARSLEQRAEWARSLGVRELTAGFAEALREELDFSLEARNLTTVAAVRDYRDVVVPRAHNELCTGRVVVMDLLDGELLGTESNLDDRDRTALARTLLHTLLTQILLDGVFLADPHPGNLLLLRDGRIGLLDFGTVGRLDSGLRTVLQRMLLAVEAGDATALADALVDVVERPEDVDKLGLERAIGRFMARHLSPALPADIEMFTDLFRVVARYGVAVPAEMALVFRALATLEGTLAQLAPGFDIVDESRAFAAEHLYEAVAPEDLRATAMAEAVKLLPLIRRLPRRLDRITSALEHGQLSAGVRPFADQRDRNVVTRLVHQTLLTLLAAATGLVAALILGTPGGPAVAQDLSLYQLIAYSLLIASGALTLRVLTSMLRR